uniref:Retrotransposon gag domain-containing protein n=1 Tax=Arundo donax TaxID=35708 RepID=A0A0A9C7E6_ARUDO
MLRAAIELLEDSAYDWWKRYPHEHFIKTWENLKKAMRNEFVPKEYELILLHRLKNIKQGSKSVLAFYDEL